MEQSVLIDEVSTSKREDPTAIKNPPKQNKRQSVQTTDRFRLIAVIAILPANPPLHLTFILQPIQLLARLAVIIMSVKRVLVIAGSDSSGGA